MTDRDILSAIQNRDEQVLGYVIRKYSRLLWKTASTVLVNAASAQDVEECVADAFIYFWCNPEKYNPDKAKFSGWLSMVVRSRAIDRYRQLLRKNEIPLDEIVMDSLKSENLPSSDNNKDLLRRCLHSLSDKERTLLVRRYYYAQKPAQIAEAMGISKKQVENGLYYAKQKLKHMLMHSGGKL